ncbi:MAG: hypothetical protein D6820_09720 [Lentisphaerae bacterium]|nr:MAG: hypothetical protein D6820_09720 [Lentisphaerota bacterium]
MKLENSSCLLLCLSVLFTFQCHVLSQDSDPRLAQFGDYAKPAHNASRYKLVKYSMLKAQKKEYKNDRVQYEAVYLGFNDNFPEYVERSGFRSSRYYYLLAGDLSIPIIVKRSDDIASLLANLKKGSRVRVYGKLRKFKVSPKHPMFPEYYVELEHITVLALPGRNQNQPNQDPHQRPHRPWRRRL